MRYSLLGFFGYILNLYFYSMLDNHTEIDLLRATLGYAGMKPEAFDLSLPYWKLKQYKKGEFYNEYKNVCKHLGFVINGVFRIYRVNNDTGEEKNMLFFTDHQFVASYKSFLAQTACDYYTEAMADSIILYIHTISHRHATKESDCCPHD